MYIVNDYDGNVWDKVECATLEDAKNEAFDLWYHLTERERNRRQVFDIEEENGDIIFDFLDTAYYAFVSCVMGDDFIELDAKNMEDAMAESREWFSEKFASGIDWEYAYIVRCPLWMDDDGEMFPDESRYVEYKEIEREEI